MNWFIIESHVWPSQMPDYCREMRPKHTEAAMQSTGKSVRLDYGLRALGRFQIHLPPCRDYMFEFDMGSHRQPEEGMLEGANSRGSH